MLSFLSNVFSDRHPNEASLRKDPYTIALDALSVHGRYRLDDAQRERPVTGARPQRNGGMRSRSVGRTPCWRAEIRCVH